MISQYILFCSLTITSLLATPHWYYNIDNSKPNIYIGYGSATSETEAKQNALIDISSQISIKIETQLQTTKTHNSNGYNKDIQVKSSQSTNTNINDYKIEKISYENGTYFIAISYENISTIDKFIHKIKSKKLLNEKQNRYIKNSYLAQNINKALGVSLNFKLLRKDRKWYLKYQDIIQVIDKKDFEQLFTTIINQNLMLNTNKKDNILYDKDAFFFKIKSKKDGFISILSVYEDGTVSTLVQNIPLQKNSLNNIPNKDYESILEAGLITQGIDTFDMYIAVFSTKKIIFDQFTQADSELIEDERSKNFDELIDFLDDKEFSSLKVVTKAR